MKEERRKRVRKSYGILSYFFSYVIWQESKHTLLCILAVSLMVNILSLVFPLVLLQVYDRVVPNQSTMTLSILVVIVVISLLLIAVFKIMRTYIGAWADAKYEHIKGCKAFDRLLSCEMLKYDAVGPGEFYKRFNAFYAMRDFFSGVAIISVVDVPFVVIFLLTIWYIGGWVVIAPAVMIAILFYNTVAHLGKLKQNLLNKKEIEERRLNFMIETITNIETVKSITMEALMLRRYERLQRSTVSRDYMLANENMSNMNKVSFMSQLTLAILVGVGAISIMNGGMSLGGLAACVLLAGRCFQPVNSVIGVLTRVQSIKLAQQDISKLSHFPVESEPEASEEINAKSDIVFKDVNFRYTKDSPYLFEHFNLRIKENENLLIVGDQLCGKTTLLWLCLGIYQPESGEILINNENIKNYQSTYLRKKISYLPNEGALFQGSIMENITLFDEKRYYDRAMELSQRIGLDKVVSRLSKGYKTQVGQQVVESLSMGVQQKIAIVRALVRDPDVLLFDNANISLDLEGDKLLHDMLEECSKDKTIIIVSQRPSIMRLATRCVRLHNGQVYEEQLP